MPSDWKWTEGQERWLQEQEKLHPGEIWTKTLRAAVVEIEDKHNLILHLASELAGAAMLLDGWGGIKSKGKEIVEKLKRQVEEIERLRTDLANTQRERDTYAAAGGALMDANEEIERLQQRCTDSDAVNARYVKRVAMLTDGAEDWHRVADERAGELVKLQQRVAELERDAKRLDAILEYGSEIELYGSSGRIDVEWGYGCKGLPADCEESFVDGREAIDAAIVAAKAGESGEG